MRLCCKKCFRNAVGPIRKFGVYIKIGDYSICDRRRKLYTEK